MISTEMSNGTLTWQVLESLLIKKAKASKRRIPELSLALSDLDYLMRWQVKDKEGNLIATVNGEFVEWVDE